MRKLTAFESVTLDGVMQAPAGEDEDRIAAAEARRPSVRYFRTTKASTSTRG